ncbi:hypothetical protein BH09DEP1_BH09DEP1_1470 [soil metagenome]
MKKIVLQNCLLFMLLITSLASASDCCNPLTSMFECGTWAYQFRGGVYPTLWSKRGDILLEACDCVTNVAAESINLGKIRKFNDYFKIPFIVGTQLIYRWSDCFSGYFEINFIQAVPKKTARNTEEVANEQLAIRFGHYRATSGYLGAYYDVARFCNESTLFVGAKIGAIYHSNIYAHQVVATPEVNCICEESFRRTFFKHGVRISGGVNVGVDYKWCDCWSVALMGEAVISGGPKGTCAPLLNSEILALLGGSALSSHTIKTEVSFPVTLGLIYNF